METATKTTSGSPTLPATTTTTQRPVTLNFTVSGEPSNEPANRNQIKLILRIKNFDHFNFEQSQYLILFYERFYRNVLKTNL